MFVSASVMADCALTPEEQYKYDVVSKVINKEIKPGLAAKFLGISTRQIRRLKIAVQEEGSQAMIHGLKGKFGNHRIDPLVKTQTLDVIRKIYHDFNPGFAAEILEEQHAVSITSQTIRMWMSEEGLWKIRKQHRTGIYRSWRPRKEYYGELEQFDGSYHHWFEKRYCDESGESIEVCLLASIDDATGKITKAVFAANEGIQAVFTFWKEYIQEHGKPVAIYLDKFATYKINHKQAVDNNELMTQFQRAMQSLSIELITAHSPQAKGRIERLFQTLQDRLVKEMRLANINTPEDGNPFLRDVFLPKFNNKFSVVPVREGNVHKALSTDDREHINHIFSVQSSRRINNDFTIQYKNHWYQLAEVQPTTMRAKETVIVELWLDGSIHFTVRGFYLVYFLLPERPTRSNKNPTILTTHKLNWKPAADHPWRKLFKSRH